MAEQYAAPLSAARGDLLVACWRCHVLLPAEKLYQQNGKPICLGCLTSSELSFVLAAWVDQHGQP